jgi:hypothetical protein
MMGSDTALRQTGRGEVWLGVGGGGEGAKNRGRESRGIEWQPKLGGKEVEEEVCVSECEG